MNILVAVKSVPDPNAIRFDSAGNYAASTPRVMNEYDQYAVEEAIRIKESGRDADITVVSVGPAGAKDIVTRALAMGADQGVLVVSDGAALDSLQVATLLAAEVRAGTYDLVIVGQETSDAGTGNVGPQLAALLGLPLVSNVVKLEFDSDSTVTLQREVEDGRQVVRAKLPILVCALTGLNEPRFPSLKGIMAARRKPIIEKPASDVTGVRSKTSWTNLRPEARRVQGTMISDDAESAALKVVELLREKKLI